MDFRLCSEKSGDRISIDVKIDQQLNLRFLAKIPLTRSLITIIIGKSKGVSLSWFIAGICLCPTLGVATTSLVET
jgi:hypothetical protein